MNIIIATPAPHSKLDLCFLNNFTIRRTNYLIFLLVLLLLFLVKYYALGTIIFFVVYVWNTRYSRYHHTVILIYVALFNYSNDRFANLILHC